MMREIINPDKNKAKSLFKMSEELLKRLEKYNLIEFPSPSLSDLYDATHMLIEGIFQLKGIKFKGEGAHFEMIEETKKINLFSESEESLIQQIRGMRNRYKYEGFNVDVDYLNRNQERILMIINKLKKAYDKLI